MLVNQPRMS